MRIPGIIESCIQPVFSMDTIARRVNRARLKSNGDYSSYPNLETMSMLPHTIEVVVRKIAHEAEGTLSFELMHAHGRSLPAFTAGAHIRIGLPGGLERSYSLVNEQGENWRYVIAVALDAASRGGSRYIHEVLCVNDTLRVSEPRNNF